MENKVNYTCNKFCKTFFIHGVMKKTQNIRQNPEKWGCNSLQYISIAAFHLY